MKSIAFGLAVAASAILGNAAQAATYGVEITATFFSFGQQTNYGVSAGGEIDTDDDFIIDTGLQFFNFPNNVTGEGEQTDQYSGFSLIFFGLPDDQVAFGFGLDGPTFFDVGSGSTQVEFAPVINFLFDRSIVSTLTGLGLNEMATAPLSSFSSEEVEEVATFAGTPTGSFVSGSAKFTLLTAPPVAAIPLPAAGWLLLAGLSGLAAMRRAHLR